MSGKEISKTNSDAKHVERVEGQPPMIIDLPEGQKIVIGEIDPRTTIEVSTWQGLGKPNTKTNRIRIGVTKDEEETETTFVPEIEEKQYQATPIKTGVNSSNLFPVALLNQDESAQSRNSTSYSRKILKIAISIFVIVPIIWLLAGPGQLRFIHPNSGNKTTVGKMNTNIVLIQKSKNYSPGDKIITNIDNKKLSPIYSQIDAIFGDKLLISNNQGNYSIEKSQVQGKALVLIPFLGIFSNLMN